MNKKTGDGVDDASKLALPANQADIEGAWAAGANDCSNKASGKNPAPDGAMIVAESKVTNRWRFQPWVSATSGLHLSRWAQFDCDIRSQCRYDYCGVTGQATITQSTQDTVNVPVEAYWEYGSIQSQATTSAFFYLDVKAGGDWISHALGISIGTKRIFDIEYPSAGIEFAKSARIGMQYFFGQSQAYCGSSGSGCTPPTTGFNGFQSFAPPPAKAGS